MTSKGEAASAGTPEERVQEARDAARIIGAAIQFLELGGDCHIEHTPANGDAARPGDPAVQTGGGLGAAPW